MAAIRRSGGTVVLQWQGTVPDPDGDEFAAALQQRRFRTIETAASEEISVGWVSPGDPTGDTFEAEHMAAGHGTWLRMRIDKKVLPQKWVAVHRAVAERERGRKLSVRERRELKDGLMDSLLPRVLPTIGLVDALLFAERKLVLLFATGTNVREAFQKLFFETFTTPLERIDAYRLATLCKLGGEQMAALDRLEPVRWPSEQQSGARVRRVAPVPAAVREQEAGA